MTSSARSSPLDIAIVGGGISGLAAGHRLLELGTSSALRVGLFEGSDRFGGVVRTQEVEGCLLEAGPDSLVTQKRGGLELCRQLGLEEELLEPLQPAGIRVVYRGRLVPLPDGMQMVAPTQLLALLRSPLFSAIGKARILAEPLVPTRTGGGEESVSQFVGRRYGAEMVERIAEPVLGGLFTADVDRLSADCAAPRLLELERRFGSLTRGLRGAVAPQTGGRPAVISLRRGMEQLTRALAEELPTGWRTTGAEVTELRRAGPRFVLRFRDRPPVETRAVLLALPAFVSGRLLAEIDLELSHALTALPYASCATLSLVYDRSQLAKLPAGSGFFVPRTEGLPILACNYSSLKLEGRAPAERIVLRTFLGGAVRPTALDSSDDELIASAHRCMAQLLDIRGEPRLTLLHRFVDTMPQFVLGESERRAAVKRGVERHETLGLCGAAVGAFGLPDCIESGRAAVDTVLARLLSDSTSEGAEAGLRPPQPTPL